MYVSAVTKVATCITITVINRGHDNFYVTLQELKLHFLGHHKKQLRWAEISVLYNKWYIFMLFTEVLLFVSIILKIISEYTVSCYLNYIRM